MILVFQWLALIGLGCMVAFAIYEMLFNHGLTFYDNRNDWPEIELARREKELRAEHEELVEVLEIERSRRERREG